MEVVIASVILAIAIAAFSSVLIYQANLSHKIAIRDQAYQIMESKLGYWSNATADYYGNFYTNPSMTGNSFFQSYAPSQSASQLEKESTGNFQETSNIALAPIGTETNPFNVDIVNRSTNNPNYYLFQITVTVSWNNGSRSVTGTALVAP